MLQVDLSTLRGPELRRLLDATRQRGQAALSYEILQEMALRRERRESERPRGPFAAKRPSEPRVISVDLGDPLEPKEEPQETADWDPPEESAQDATFIRQEPSPSPSPAPRRLLWLSIGVAVGLSAGVVLGWRVGGAFREPGAAPDKLAAAVPAAAAPVSQPPAEAAPPPAPSAAPSEPTPSAAPEAADREPPPDLPPAAQAAQESADLSQEGASTPRAPQTGATKSVPAQASDLTPGAQAKAKRCATEPSPADQTICGDQRLQRLQRELQKAYAEALQAHEDRALLRQHQLAWRGARNSVTDPERLAQLYEERIRKLNAATAAALKER